jgi:uncharacterized protein YjbI with pentapeptide repeats
MKHLILSLYLVFSLAACASDHEENTESDTIADVEAEVIPAGQCSDADHIALDDAPMSPIDSLGACRETCDDWQCISNCTAESVGISVDCGRCFARLSQCSEGSCQDACSDSMASDQCHACIASSDCFVDLANCVDFVPDPPDAVCSDTVRQAFTLEEVSPEEAELTLRDMLLCTRDCEEDTACYGTCISHGDDSPSLECSECIMNASQCLQGRCSQCSDEQPNPTECMACDQKETCLTELTRCMDGLGSHTLLEGQIDQDNRAHWDHAIIATLEHTDDAEEHADSGEMGVDHFHYFYQESAYHQYCAVSRSGENHHHALIHEHTHLILAQWESQPACSEGRPCAEHCATVFVPKGHYTMIATHAGHRENSDSADDSSHDHMFIIPTRNPATDLGVEKADHWKTGTEDVSGSIHATTTISYGGVHQGGNFDKLDLSGQTFTDVVLNGASFVGTNLQGTTFRGSAETESVPDRSKCITACKPQAEQASPGGSTAASLDRCLVDTDCPQPIFCDHGKAFCQDGFCKVDKTKKAGPHFGGNAQQTGDTYKASNECWSKDTPPNSDSNWFRYWLHFYWKNYHPEYFNNSPCNTANYCNGGTCISKYNTSTAIPQNNGPNDNGCGGQCPAVSARDPLGFKCFCPAGKTGPRCTQTIDDRERTEGNRTALLMQTKCIECLKANRRDVPKCSLVGANFGGAIFGKKDGKHSTFDKCDLSSGDHMLAAGTTEIGDDPITKTYATIFSNTELTNVEFKDLSMKRLDLSSGGYGVGDPRRGNVGAGPENLWMGPAVFNGTRFTNVDLSCSNGTPGFVPKNDPKSQGDTVFSGGGTKVPLSLLPRQSPVSIGTPVEVKNTWYYGIPLEFRPIERVILSDKATVIVDSSLRSGVTVDIYQEIDGVWNDPETDVGMWMAFFQIDPIPNNRHPDQSLQLPPLSPSSLNDKDEQLPIVRTYHPSVAEVTPANFIHPSIVRVRADIQPPHKSDMKNYVFGVTGDDTGVLYLRTTSCQTDKRCNLEGYPVEEGVNTTVEAIAWNSSWVNFRDRDNAFPERGVSASIPLWGYQSSYTRYQLEYIGINAGGPGHVSLFVGEEGSLPNELIGARWLDLEHTTVPPLSWAEALGEDETLSDARFVRGSSFTNATFQAGDNYGAEQDEWIVNEASADQQKMAHFCRFTGGQWAGTEAVFSIAEDPGYWQYCQFDLAQMDKVTFESAQLQGSNWNKAHSKNSLFANANLTNATMSHAVFSGTHLANAVLTDSTLNYIDLSGGTLTNAHFTDALMPHANLCSNTTSAQNAVFDGATLTEALMCHADFTKASFKLANVDKAQFHNANLQGTDFSVVSALHAQFCGTTFKASYEANASAALLLNAFFPQQDTPMTFDDSLTCKKVDPPLKTDGTTTCPNGEKGECFLNKWTPQDQQVETVALGALCCPAPPPPPTDPQTCVPGCDKGCIDIYANMMCQHVPTSNCGKGITGQACTNGCECSSKVCSGDEGAKTCAGP